MILIAYAFVAAALAGGFALAAERALRASGRQGRGPWLIAPILSLLLPALAWSGRGLVQLPVTAAETGAAAVAGASWPAYAWATLSGVLLLLLACDAVRLRARSRRWIPARVAGVPVRIAARTGPATLGIVRPVIVLPHWALTLRPSDRRLIVLHEVEHVRAGDVATLACAAALLVLVPWHPLLWWQAARLHRAIELDCDARVARRVPNVRRYARLLLRAGEHTARAPLLAAAFGRRRSLLERRIDALVTAGPRRRRGALAFAAAGFIGACLTPAPDITSPGEPAGTYTIREGAVGTARIRPAGVIRRAPSGRSEFRAMEAPPGADGERRGGVVRLRERPPR